MSLRYRLTCEKCGHAYPVETSQSGGEIVCECGATLRIPTMLKMKRLEEWDAPEADAEPEAAPAASASEESSAAQPSQPEASSVQPSSDETPESAPVAEQGKKRRLSAGRRGLLVVALVIFFGSVFMVANALPSPPPRAVFYRQTNYSLGDGRRINRDTTPPSISDYNFYYFTDYSDPERRVYQIDDNLIDHMNDFVCVQYAQYLKTLDLSDNFYDNYEALKTQRFLFLVGFGLLALVSLGVAIFAVFVKERKKQVGTMRGADWN